MGIEYLGEKVFRDEVAASGQVWIARGIYRNIYAQEIADAGFSLPVWSNRDRVVEFLQNARLVGPKYEPEAVSLDYFTGAWLSDQLMAVVELQINPDGRSTRVLVFTAEEFKSAHQPT